MKDHGLSPTFSATAWEMAEGCLEVAEVDGELRPVGRRSWRNVLEGAAAIRRLRGVGDGQALYEVDAKRGGGTNRYLVREFVRSASQLVAGNPLAAVLAEEEAL